MQEIGELLQAPQREVIDPSAVVWHKPNSKSCVYDLISDRLDATADVCQFSVRKEVIQPHYMQLLPVLYLLFNFSNIWVTCGNGPAVKHPDCNPCRIMLACACSLRAAEGNFTSGNLADCEDSYQAKPYYPVNLAILQNFYDLTNFTIQGRRPTGNRLPPGGEVVDLANLELPLFAEKTNRLLSADSEASYSLHKLANNLQNESVALHGSAEALLYDYLGRATSRLSSWDLDLRDWRTWTLLVIITLCAALTYSTYTLHRRVMHLHSKISVVVLGGLVGARSVVQAEVLSLKTSLASSTAIPPADTTEGAAFITNLIAQIRHADVVLLTFVIAVALLILSSVLIALRRALTPRSYVFLEVKAETRVALFPIFTFPDGSRYYSVAITALGLQLRLKDCGLLGILYLSVKD